jgi:hypothetical protein
VRGIRLCEPCSHLDKPTRPGVLKGLIHGGELRAQIVLARGHGAEESGKARAGAEAKDLPGVLAAEAVREESFTLAAGWNLVHLFGEPLVADARGALAAIEWISLWT